MKEITIARIYGHMKADGTYRILVDRLWPRGIKKSDLEFDEWDKEIAPSPALRKWFNHKPERFEEFSQLYDKELLEKESELEKIRTKAKTTPVTLLYGAKDAEINHAVVLMNRLKRRE